jgi:hypothetical protein
MTAQNGFACFFRRQVQHWTLLIVLLGITWAIRPQFEIEGPVFAGLSVRTWFLLSLGIPILHQVFVWFAWRAELCYSAVSRTFGEKGFEIYAVLFSVIGISRVLSVIGLGIADFQSLSLHPGLTAVLLILLTPAAVYTGYSVGKFFGFRRAFGIDHFDPAYRNKPFVKGGIFKYFNNGMYWCGFLVFWVAAIACDSRLALLAALFNHAYIWVHYHCTEKPDMRLIYGGRSAS